MRSPNSSWYSPHLKPVLGVNSISILLQPPRAHPGKIRYLSFYLVQYGVILSIPVFNNTLNHLFIRLTKPDCLLPVLTFILLINYSDTLAIVKHISILNPHPLSDLFNQPQILWYITLLLNQLIWAVILLLKSLFRAFSLLLYLKIYFPGDFCNILQSLFPDLLELVQFDFIFIRLVIFTLVPV